MDQNIDIDLDLDEVEDELSMDHKEWMRKMLS